jgi:chemotaxis protein MotB
MRSVKLLGVCLVGAFIVLASGCNGEMKDLRIQNDRQRKLIADLESQLTAAKLQRDQLQRQVDEAQQKGGIETESLRKQIAALEADITKKSELIKSMQERLLGVTPLPVEVTTKLEDLAKQHSDMITYDATRGIVRFKSDLLFEKGSDQVAATAIEAVKSLCNILNSEAAQEFDVIIAGHTDDIPIEKPDTRAKHPSNWHLSVHRGISVLQIMTGNNLKAERLSVRGFGEYRPVVPNSPGKKGNAQNRRVEIYIVPSGT